jgi:hypothetical protein
VEHKHIFSLDFLPISAIDSRQLVSMIYVSSALLHRQLRLVSRYHPSFSAFYSRSRGLYSPFVLSESFSWLLSTFHAIIFVIIIGSLCCVFLLGTCLSSPGRFISSNSSISLHVLCVFAVIVKRFDRVCP